ERTTAHRRRLLNEGIDALTAAVTRLAPPTKAQQPQNYPRSALLHSTFLARAHLMQGNLEQGVEATRYALDRLGEVQSPRCRRYLRNLGAALARRGRPRLVRDLPPGCGRAVL